VTLKFLLSKPGSPLRPRPPAIGRSRHSEAYKANVDLHMRSWSLAHTHKSVDGVQAYLLQRGRYDELHAMIEKQGRQIDNLIKPGRRERH